MPYNEIAIDQKLTFFTRHHRELMRSLSGDYDATLVQHGFPIIVDKEALDSALEGKHQLNGAVLTPDNQGLK
jgi:hypothetical protein